LYFVHLAEEKRMVLALLPDNLFEDYLISFSKTFFTCSWGSTRRSLYGKHLKTFLENQLIDSARMKREARFKMQYVICA